MNEIQEVAQRVRPLKILWFSMILGVLAVTVVALLVIRRGAVTPVEALRTGTGMYVAIVLLIGLVGAQFVRRLVDRPSSYATRGEVARRWQTGWIVGQAIKEGVGLAGLVLSLFVGSAAWALAFGMASAVSMTMTPPWETELLHRLQRYPADSGRPD